MLLSGPMRQRGPSTGAYGAGSGAWLWHQAPPAVVHGNSHWT